MSFCRRLLCMNKHWCCARRVCNCFLLLTDENFIVRFQANQFLFYSIFFFKMIEPATIGYTFYNSNTPLLRYYKQINIPQTPYTTSLLQSCITHTSLPLYPNIYLCTQQHSFTHDFITVASKLCYA